MAALFASITDIYNELSSLGEFQDDLFTLHDKAALQKDVIDRLVWTSVFSEDQALKETAQKLIHAIATDLGVQSASHFSLYQAISRGEVSGFTVPAINMRALTYDSARIIFRLAKKHDVGAFILELARSEMSYTFQDPAEFAACILAAAVKEDYTGHVFLQGDHYQVKPKAYEKDPTHEITELKHLIESSLKAQLYNIDIDASTLVDLKQPTLPEQQQRNAEITAELTNFTRENQPDGVTVSIGGEIGHIGDRNSTVEDFTAFMDQYKSLVKGQGITKVSAQTGSSHGGTVDETGKVQEVTIDFSVIEAVGKAAREQYGMGGAVQHGASTLSLDLYPTFVEKKTLEIHLSTMFQNLIFDAMPESLRSEIQSWVTANCSDDRKPDWNDIQFFYKMRKKAIGPFKKQLWSLSNEEMQPILSVLEKEYETIFEKLQVFNTRDVVSKYT